MPTLRYLHLDVFTARRYEGNQLAVFTDARQLSPQQMQTLAREMNFSESTFLLPAEQPGTDLRVRIFTPFAELPMAGHPTIGSTFALALDGVLTPDQARVVFGLGVGPTSVELTWQEGHLAFAWMDQRPPEFRVPLSTRADILRAAGVDPAAADATGLPIEEVSCGLPFLLIPLATRAAVDKADPEVSSLRRVTSAFPDGRLGVFVFSTEPVDDQVTAYSRMFAPELGVAEDPATGSASGPLGCYLVKHSLVPQDRWPGMLSLQGVAMGRPSRLHMRITASGPHDITRVQVGGQSVKVGEGWVDI
jgi:trans-2,3-dihydro-3-hydroxyanthranilate isomerase